MLRSRGSNKAVQVESLDGDSLCDLLVDDGSGGFVIEMVGIGYQVHRTSIYLDHTPRLSVVSVSVFVFVFDSDSDSSAGFG